MYKKRKCFKPVLRNRRREGPNRQEPHHFNVAEPKPPTQIVLNFFISQRIGVVAGIGAASFALTNQWPAKKHNAYTPVSFS
jgi:hypothetical protein